MTTNHKDKLDPSLTRPGRIDYILELNYANKRILSEMYDSYFNDDKLKIIIFRIYIFHFIVSIINFYLIIEIQVIY